MHAHAATLALYPLSYHPPFDWDFVLGFLTARTVPGVEEIAEGCYRRKVCAGGHEGWISVSHRAENRAVVVELPPQLCASAHTILPRVHRLFGLGARPDAINEHLAADPRLSPLVRARPGIRVPGAFNGFEMAVRAILGQQVSVKAARTLAGRVAAAFEGMHRADRVAAAPLETIRGFGLTAARAQSVLALAQAVDGGLRLEPGVDIPRTMEALKKLPGVGEWTAQYIAMRALGWADAFPHTDLGIYKALDTRSPKDVLRLSQPWSPWRSYATMHLWAGLS